MNYRLLIISMIAGLLIVLQYPQQSLAQFPGSTPPIHRGGGIQGFGDNIPEECNELIPLRNQISSDGLLGTVYTIGSMTTGQIGDMMGNVMGIASDIGLNLAVPGLGSVFGGMLGGLLGGGDDGTKKAVEELTKVQMTALVEAECHSILQDIYLTVLGEKQKEIIEDSEYNQQDVRENIRKIEIARENLGYLRNYLADEYQLLYDTWNRHKEYEQNPEYWRQIRTQYADYNIQEADKLIISARENQRMTGQTHEYLDVLTGLLSREDLTPAQAQQLQGYITALHAQELTEAKHILAGQAAFMAQLEVERKQQQRDEEWFQQRHREHTNEGIQTMSDQAQATPTRRIVPSWAGSN
jgi:hypothetical protein